jgi:hypothetical protein
MSQRDPQFRDSVSVLGRLARFTPAKLNNCARENGLALRTVNEDYRVFLSRVWSRITGRDDFELAYSALMLLETMKGDVGFARRTPETMRDRIQNQVGSNLKEIEREENKTDTEFMGLLRQV